MSGVKTSATLLGDFRTDARVLVLAALAVPIGIVSALVAKALLWLIAEISNVLSAQPGAGRQDPHIYDHGDGTEGQKGSHHSGLRQSLAESR